MHLYSKALERTCQAFLQSDWQITINGPKERVHVLARWSLDPLRYNLKG